MKKENFSAIPHSGFSASSSFRTPNSELRVEVSPMSVFLDPLETRSLFATALAPMTVGESATGPIVALPDGDGPVHALVQTGAYSDESDLAVSFEESDTGAAWSAIDGSAVPGLSPNSLALHAFPRTKRFLRCQVVVTGADTDAVLAVLVGQSYKLF